MAENTELFSEYILKWVFHVKLFKTNNNVEADFKAKIKFRESKKKELN